MMIEKEKKTVKKSRNSLDFWDDFSQNFYFFLNGEKSERCTCSRERVEKSYTRKMSNSPGQRLNFLRGQLTKYPHQTYPAV